MDFNGFDPTAIALLAELPSYDAERYGAVRDQLDDGLRQPGLALIGEIANRFDRPLTIDRRTSVSPLHNDLRFAGPDTPRYKDHLLLSAWSGANKRESARIWVRIAPDGVGFASGIGFTPAIRERWRSAVGGRAGAGLAKAIGAVEDKYRKCSAQVTGDQLARVPRGFDENHPRADLLRRTGFQLRFLEPLPKSVSKPSFLPWCLRRLHDLEPVHRWLDRHLAPPSAAS